MQTLLLVLTGTILLQENHALPLQILEQLQCVYVQAFLEEVGGGLDGGGRRKS